MLGFLSVDITCGLATNLNQRFLGLLAFAKLQTRNLTFVRAVIQLLSIDRSSFALLKVTSCCAALCKHAHHQLYAHV